MSTSTCRVCLMMLVVCAAPLGCSSDFQTSPNDGAVADAPPPGVEAGTPSCRPGHDEDGDKIPDDVEGCTVDSDGDKIPDYADTDSDNDKVPDAIEAGPDPTHPVDSDGDKIPDYKDTDSDNDGVPDGNEDINGDGKLGCCMDKCGEKRKGCPDLKADECGKGQKCVAGACQPAAAFLCANGESDPKKKQTFPGSDDSALPNFVCQKPDETGAKGLKPMQFRKSTAGDWHVALEKDAVYGETTIAGPKGLEAAATFDLSGPDQAEAGFIVSLPTTATDVSPFVSALVAKISNELPGKASVQQVVSGTISTSHDKFPTVVGTQLAITLTGGKNPPAVRNDLLPILLSRAPSELSALPAANYGPSSTTLVLSFQTLLRAKDGRLLVMGAVADKGMSQDNSKKTGFHLDDMSNGTGLATAADGDTVTCDNFILENKPVADILWVVDESGSMDTDRQNIVNNASDFFARALKAGLDFRMGVAGVKDPTYGGVSVGKLCSKASTDYADDGGTDRFLLPSEQSIFQACITNPPYYEGGSEYGLSHMYGAVTSHLPRKANDPAKIRPDATLVVIMVTDEAPQELKSGTTYNGKTGFLGYSEYDINVCSSSKMSQIQSYIADWLTLYQGKHPTYGAEGKAIVHLIAGVCKDNSCGDSGMPVEYPWGYEQIAKATGGQTADVCQKNLGTTLQLIIDSISGAASPAVLGLVPISASLAVAINKTQLQRSRVSGFDYISASNSLLFIGVPFNKGDMVVASYRRWIKQQPIE
jgi:hypothetical protein